MAENIPTDAMVEEAERGLAWRSELGRGGTEIGIARARDISNRKNLSDDTVVRMNSYFARHEVDKDAEGFRPGEEGYPSNGRIAWALWGGDAGQAWAARKVQEMIDAKAEDARPYPNEHAARITEPGQYDSFARVNDALGDGIDGIYGVKGDEGSELQAIRFDAARFTADEARSWLRENYFSPIKFEEATGERAEPMSEELETRHVLEVSETEETVTIVFAKPHDEPMAEEVEGDLEDDLERKASAEIHHRAMGMDAEVEDDRRVRMSISSEKPVERSYGMEILDHDERAIDLSFLNSGNAPLLLDHDPERQIGVIESVNLDSSARRLRATVRFSKSALGSEVLDDVRGRYPQKCIYRVSRRTNGTRRQSERWEHLSRSRVDTDGGQYRFYSCG
jgi:hypothetical protein